MLKVFWLRSSKSLLCLGMSTLNVLCRPCCHAWYKAFGSLVALWTKSWRSLLHKQERKNITNCLKHSSWYVCLSNIFWSSIFAKHMLNCRDIFLWLPTCHAGLQSAISSLDRRASDLKKRGETRSKVDLRGRRGVAPVVLYTLSRKGFAGHFGSYWDQYLQLSLGFCQTILAKELVEVKRITKQIHRIWKIWFAWFSKKEVIDTIKNITKAGVFGSRDGSRDGVFLDRCFALRSTAVVSDGPSGSWEVHGGCSRDGGRIATPTMCRCDWPWLKQRLSWAKSWSWLKCSFFGRDFGGTRTDVNWF